MVSGHLYLLPIIVFLWFPITFITTYIIAVENEDVFPVLPYISDTGTFSPESCIFGQMLNTGSILMALVIYFRYRQVEEICKRHDVARGVQKMNRICLWLGVIGAFGVSMVGNFQESNILVVHAIGAFLAFGFSTLYQGLQTFVCIKIYPAFGRRQNNYIRMVLTTVCSICFLLCILFAALSFVQFKGNDVTKWKEQDGGYQFHLVSTATEWITAMCTMGYILTFTPDFKRMTVDEPVVTVEDNFQTDHKQNGRNVASGTASSSAKY